MLTEVQTQTSSPAAGLFLPIILAILTIIIKILTKILVKKKKKCYNESVKEIVRRWNDGKNI